MAKKPCCPTPAVRHDALETLRRTHECMHFANTSARKKRIRIRLTSKRPTLAEIKQVGRVRRAVEALKLPKRFANELTEETKAVRRLRKILRAREKDFEEKYERAMTASRGRGRPWVGYHEYKKFVGKLDAILVAAVKEPQRERAEYISSILPHTPQGERPTAQSVVQILRRL